MSSLTQFAENMTQGLFSWFRYDLGAYCKLEAPYDEHTLITENGGLLSMFELAGVRNMPGDSETRKIVQTFYREIASAFRRGDHAIQIVFEHDPDSIDRDLELAYQPARATIARLGLDLDYVIDNDKAALSQFCSKERCYLVVSTHPSTLSKGLLKRSLRERQLWMAKENIPFITSAQNPFNLIPELVHPHRSFVESLNREMNEVGMVLRLMNVHDLCREVRMAVDQEFTSPDWGPSLVAGQALKGKETMKKSGGGSRRERVPVKNTDPAGNDASHAWYPQLGRQLIPRRFKVEAHKDFPSSDPVRIGSKWYASQVMERGPVDDPQAFQTLFDRVPADVPWRVSFEFKPGGLSAMAMKRTFLAIFGWMGEVNGRLKKAYAELDAIEKKGDPVVGFRVNALTWASTPRELAGRHMALSLAFQSWGKCDMTDDIGDPVDGVMAAAPALTDDNPAPSLAPPLSDVISMLPLVRPASPWASGSFLSRTPDGKPYPIQQGSDLQDNWNDLLWGPPGSAKSVTLNSMILAGCTSPGLTELPMVTLIDVGPSGTGTIDLIKDALPEDKKHMAGYFRLRLDPEHTINPFSIPLGCEAPTPFVRDFQINFLTQLMTPAGKKEPYEMAAQMAGVMVDEVFKLLSSRGQPKLYEEHAEPRVDQALREIGSHPAEADSWWKVRDMLFAAGRIHEAGLAQEWAVPILQDFMRVVKSNAVTDLFAESANNAVQAGNGQLLVDAFTTVISSAIREYKLLNGPTRFDLGDARMVVLDLQEVAGGDSPEGKRRTAIMFLLARHVGTRNFYAEEEVTKLCGEKYTAYHQRRNNIIKEIFKLLAYDELHLTGGSDAVRQQLINDMRLGRKSKIRVTLASQLVEDFDEEMLKLASSIYILKASNEDDIELAKKKFRLSAAAADVIWRHLNGPRPEGANFLGIFTTKDGRYAQLLTNTIGTIKRWALSTTGEDMGLRRRMYAELGVRRGLETLVRWFPRGTAIPEIKRRGLNMGQEDFVGAIDSIFREIIDHEGQLRPQQAA